MITINSPKKKIDGRHQRSILTRQKLLDAARDVFQEVGFAKTTISQIIKRANTGYGTAYVHFKGKDDLLIVLMDNVMQKFVEMANSPFSPSTKEEAKSLVLKQVTAFLTMAKSDQEMLKIFWEARGLSHSVNNKWDEIRHTFISFITKDISYSQQKGLARTDLKAELIARSWFFANENYQWEIVQNVNTAPIDEIAKTLTTMYIDGLYINPS